MNVVFVKLLIKQSSNPTSKSERKDATFYMISNINKPIHGEKVQNEIIRKKVRGNWVQCNCGFVFCVSSRFCLMNKPYFNVKP